MKRAVEVDAFNKKMVAPRMAVEQEREKLQAKKNALQTAEQAVNRNNQKTVDEFNVRVQELKAAREAFNAAVARYNAARGDGPAGAFRLVHPQVRQRAADLAREPAAPAC